MIQACPDDQICGYGGGPYSWHPELLEEHLFWISYLGSFFHDIGVQELLIGPDWDDAEAFDKAIYASEDWPVFTVTLASGPRIDIVYRTIPDDIAIDLVFHDPAATRPRTVASTQDGAGQVLSWDQAAAADAANTGPCQARQLLLLLPLIDLEELPQNAIDLLADSLTQCTAVEQPHLVAELLIARQDSTRMMQEAMPDV